MSEGFLPNETDDVCPSAVVDRADRFYLKVHDGKCYHFVLYKQEQYLEAGQDCQRDGGTLALPKSESLNAWLESQLTQFYYSSDPAWIGLDDLDDETTFVWADGTGTAWVNFAEGNGPGSSWFTRGVEDCVAIDPLDSGKWHDFQCDSNIISWVSKPNPKKNYICQYGADGPEN